MKIIVFLWFDHITVSLFYQILVFRHTSLIFSKMSVTFLIIKTYCLFCQSNIKRTERTLRIQCWIYSYRDIFIFWHFWFFWYIFVFKYIIYVFWYFWKISEILKERKKSIISYFKILKCYELFDILGKFGLIL